jgi:uncharacterized protein YbjT (DUF2867 family)
VTTVAVLGAGGLSGSFVLSALRDRGVKARAVTHRVANRDRLLDAGATDVAVAEYRDAGALASALAGVDAVYLIPPALDPDEDLFAVNALRAAQASGAERFVYVSVLHPATPSLMHHIRKSRAEIAIRESTVAWTILQPALYAQMVWLMFGQAPAGDVPIPFNPESPFSVVDLRDLAQVGVKALLEPGHEYATYELVADTLTMASMVRTAGQVRGVSLEPVGIAPTEATLPPQFASRPSAAVDMRAMWAEYDRHGLRGNSNVLALVLGREPFGFVDAARDAFAKSGA